MLNYSFDANKRVTSFYTSDNQNNQVSRVGSGYTYTGENITGSTGFSGRTSLPGSVKEYDDKINPFFGLMDPNIDPVQRYSRNNFVKSESPGFPAFVSFYAYEYNAQGLPTKRTESGFRIEVTTFTYEAY